VNAREEPRSEVIGVTLMVEMRRCEVGGRSTEDAAISEEDERLTEARRTETSTS
jgi:hypothetical protein